MGATMGSIVNRTSRNLERGQALAEFALTIVFVMLLLVAFLELIMMMYTYNVLADSAKEGVRYAIVHGGDTGVAAGPTSGGTNTPPCTTSDTNVGTVQTQVKNFAALSLHDTSAMTVNVCYFDGDNQPPHRVNVVVRYGYQPFFGLGWPTITVNAAAAGRIMY